MRQLLFAFAYLLCLITIVRSSATTTWYTPSYDVQADTSFLSKQWDIIIVGSGTAGAVVANRLSVNPNVKVLVLEAGGPSQRATGSKEGGTFRYKVNSNGGLDIDGSWTRYDVPNLSQTLWTTGGLDPTSPRFAQWIFNGYPALGAKVLGGNAAHNGMFWHRAIPQNFQNWGINGWSYSDMLPYFKKSESMDSNTGIYPGNPYHGFTGPIKLVNPEIIEPDGSILCNATINSNPNYIFIKDLNGAATPQGCALILSNIRKGIRDSPIVAYLFNTPVIKRPNLQIRARAQVTKVIFNNAKVATGVEFADLNTGIKHTINARKTVILAGGALLTAKLLLQSGIGPAADLAAIGIPLVHNNPNVGRGIRNTPSVNVYWKSPNIRHPNFFNQPFEANQYAIDGTGMYASTGYSTFITYKSVPSRPYPDIAIIASPPDPGHLFGDRYSLAMAYQENFYADGYLKLLNNNPLSNNIFYYQNYTTPQHNADVQALVNGIKVSRQILATPPAAGHFTQELIPGPAYATDAQLAAWVRANIYEQWHYATSAKMGNPGDPLAVVDNHTRVLGVHRLRIVDASIFPNTTHGWMQATVVAVAERASALIINDLGI